MGISIIFENERFLAADKPMGWLTVPSRFAKSDERPCLLTELRARCGAVWAVHRLDVEASGLVLFAKDADAHRAANGWFAGRTIHKVYEAWTEGESSLAAAAAKSPVEWRSRIMRGKRRAYPHARGKLAVTRAKWMGSRPFRGATIQEWRLEPLTGRSHQLRFELARQGFPIEGDALYGAMKPFVSGGVALRSVKLDFAACPSAAEYGLPDALTVPGLADILAHAAG